MERPHDLSQPHNSSVVGLESLPRQSGSTVLPSFVTSCCSFPADAHLWYLPFNYFGTKVSYSYGGYFIVRPSYLFK